MAIVQISRILQRSGNLVDLPQLAEAELGFATDAKRLFIGKTLPNENVEVLTSYSTISFGQIDGSYGNINITAVQNGQILTYDSTSNVWVNAGGNASQPGNTSLYSSTPIHLGDASTLHIGGGAIGYVLETDGSGNLSWTPKGTIRSNIIGLSPDTVNSFGVATNVVVMKVANTTPYVNGSPVTITGVTGTDSSLVNSSTFYVKLSNDFPTSGNTLLFTTADLTSPFVAANLTYTNSPNGIATTAVGGGSGGSGIGGSTYSVIYNNGGVGTGDSNFTYNFNTGLLTLNGTANVGNLNATSVINGSQLISTIATGTAPLIVSSTTRISNANVETAGNLINNNSNVLLPSGGNVTISVNGTSNVVNISTTGVNIAGYLSASGNATVGNISASNGSFASLSATGNITVGNATTGNITVLGTTNLGNVSNVTITGGNANQILKTNGSGVLSWTDPTGGYYLHTQSNASTTWTIVHNLNTQYVSVNPIDNTGNSYVGRYDFPVINYTNANVVTLTFSSAVNGYCAVVGGGFTFANATPNSVPGGLNTYVQFNDNGLLSGQPTLTFNKNTSTLNVSNISVSNTTSVNTISAQSGTFTSITANTLQGVLANGTSNIAISSANGNITFSTAGIANAWTIDTTGQMYSPSASMALYAGVYMGNARYNVSNGTFTATQTNSSQMRLQSGTISWFTNVGLTPNSTFTPTLRMFLDSTGSFMVNKSFYNDQNETGLACSSTGRMTVTTNDSSSAATYHLYNINAINNGFRFYVSTNGGIYNFSAFNVNISDLRLKANIKDAPNYLDKICQIPVRTFTYKDQQDNDPNIGVIAQEVEKVMPELVSNEGFGDTPEDGIPYKTIYQTDLQYVLMKCIQEQQALIKQLRVEVDDLKQQLKK